MKDFRFLVFEGEGLVDEPVAAHKIINWSFCGILTFPFQIYWNKSLKSDIL